MRIASIVPATLTGIALLSAPAAAAGGPRDPIAVVEHIFAVADTDGSGALTREEYAAARLERYGVTFDACDLDGDGETTLAEYVDVYLRFHPSADRSKI